MENPSNKVPRLRGSWILPDMNETVDGEVVISDNDIRASFLSKDIEKKKLFRPFRTHDYIESKITNEHEVTVYKLRQISSSFNTENGYKEMNYTAEAVLSGKILKPKEKYFQIVLFQIPSLNQEITPPIERNMNSGETHPTIEKTTYSVNSDSLKVSISSQGLYSYWDRNTAIYSTEAQILLEYNSPTTLEQIMRDIHKIYYFAAFFTQQNSYPQKIVLFNKEYEKMAKLIRKIYLPEVELKKYINPLFNPNNYAQTFEKMLSTWIERYDELILFFSLFSNNVLRPNSYLETSFFTNATIIDNLLESRYGKNLKDNVYKEINSAIMKETLQNYKKSHFKTRLIRYIYENRDRLQPKLQKFIHEHNLKDSGTNNMYDLLANLIVETRIDIAHGKPRRNKKKLYGIYVTTKFLALNLLLEELSLDKEEIEVITQNEEISRI